MFITPKVTKLPTASTGIQTKISSDEVVNFHNSLLSQRGEWFAFWTADVSHLSTKKADAARAKSRRYIDNPPFKQHAKAHDWTVEYATRKVDGILTAYARIK